jgi:hypothetical protein
VEQSGVRIVGRHRCVFNSAVEKQGKEAEECDRDIGAGRTTLLSARMTSRYRDPQIQSSF